MTPIEIKEIADSLSPKLYNGSSDFFKLCSIKKEIQETATKQYSEGEYMSIAQSIKSETVIAKLIKIGRNLYAKDRNKVTLYMVSFAIATIIKEYEWDQNHYSLNYLFTISERVGNVKYDLDILFNSYLKDIDVYCNSTHNAVIMNNVMKQSYFSFYVTDWTNNFAQLSVSQIYAKIEDYARHAVLYDFHWDEYDVEGFCWCIGIFSLVCEYAGLVPNFEDAFKNAFRLYIKKGKQ